MNPALDDDAIAREIMLQCMERGASKSICPSEVARALSGSEAEWRHLMPDVKRVGDVLRAEGRIAVMQRGQPVSAMGTKGPIRFSLCLGQSIVRRALRQMGRR